MVQLAESSKFAPAFTSFQGKLFLAWTGNDPQGSLNIVSSPDGVTFGKKVTLNESSIASPSLCASNDKLYITWTGKDTNKSINILSSSDGVTFGNKVTLHESSIAAPSLCFWFDRFYLAWTGGDSETLGFINIASSSDGTTFTDKQTLYEKILGGPALSGGGNQLVMAWMGSNPSGDPNPSGYLNLAALFERGGIASKLTTIQTSNGVGGPSVVLHEGGFALGYVGLGAQDHSLVRMEGTLIDGIVALTSKFAYQDTSIAAPVFLELIGNSYVAWTGTDAGGSLNVALLKDLSPARTDFS